MASILQTDLSYYLYSEFLDKTKRVDVYLPKGYYENDEENYNLVLMNDGQDADRLNLNDTLQYVRQNRIIEDVVLVAIHADHDRLREYGTASQADYENRGDRAGAYTDFIVKELMPFLRTSFSLNQQPECNAFMGFSLGGLSALDIVWHHPQLFGRVGVFSGSFWWRSKAIDDGYTDQDRIMHKIIREGNYQPNLKFWLEVGTCDEKSDRNNSGIIDAIEDTLDIVSELEAKKYTEEDIKYVEIQGGEHNPETWGKILPNFLTWAFPRQSYGHHSGKFFI